MIKILLVLFSVGLASTANEHWFIFDQYQFPGFYTPLFRLNSTEGKTLSFALSTYDRSIVVGVNNETIKLNIERADLLYNTINHLIFLVLRDQTKLETYVNCKLIDTYLFYSPLTTKENSVYQVDKLQKNIQHYEINPKNPLTQQEIFETFSCKQSDASQSPIMNSTSTIGKPLIRKMQHVIEKVQQRKLRLRRQNTAPIPLTISSESFTIVYKPNIDNDTSAHIIFNIPELNFYIQYLPNEHLFHIRFNNENRTQYLLYADKTNDRVLSSNNSLILFLQITPTIISCYVNCELIDQEFILDTVYLQSVIQKIVQKNKNAFEYDRQSTLVLFNQPIEQIASSFFCLKLDKKNQDLLPDKYALRKFTNALDMLVNSLDNPITNEKGQSVSPVNIPPIDGYGSLRDPSTATPPIIKGTIAYDQACISDEQCSTSKCHLGRCACPQRTFWSNNSHRCIVCDDILLGSRCFRLSTHKSTWFEANDYCRDDTEQEYPMKLASNLNRTDLQYLKENFMHDNDEEHNDYMYWIGATSQFDTRKLHQSNTRTKRQVPTTIFRWYDTGETAQLNSHDIWCSQMDYNALTSINNNQLCVSLTSCGLYADDCQRNYRFICQAV